MNIDFCLLFFSKNDLISSNEWKTAYFFCRAVNEFDSPSKTKFYCLLTEYQRAKKVKLYKREKSNEIYCLRKKLTETSQTF